MREFAKSHRFHSPGSSMITLGAWLRYTWHCRLNDASDNAVYVSQLYHF